MWFREKKSIVCTDKIVIEILNKAVKPELDIKE